jgi:hypothetical protein
MSYSMTGGNFATGDDDRLMCSCGRSTTVGQHDRDADNESEAEKERRAYSTMPDPSGAAGW